MLFNSLEFLIFFFVVTVVYFLSPQRFRWILLLLSSCYFYMAFIPVYILILFFLITVDYFAALAIEKAPASQKKTYLIISILATCLILIIFKYFNFFAGSFSSLFKLFGRDYPVNFVHFILPIGLSFHTFQSLSYVIEVYRGKQKAERHYGIYALYVMFFPQLVAGPIERPQNLLHQFYEKHEFDYKRVTDGLKLMAWGLFKKAVIADRLADFVSVVYGSPMDYQGVSFITATVFFAFQIFCDFSGYSDMAIGAAQVLGFKLMNNFERPYHAKTITEFWHRWHISLSTWFRDYVYIPLGGNKVHEARWLTNIFITFLLSGLWHGANWTFVIWGALNGLYLIIGILTKTARQKFVSAIGLDKIPFIYRPLQVLTVFVLITFSWIFFRANNLHEAFYIASHLFSGVGAYIAGLTQNHFSTNDPRAIAPILVGQPLYQFAIAIMAIFGMEVMHSIQKYGGIRARLSTQPVLLRWAAYYVLIGSLFFFGVFEKSMFIYFQF
jgi:alginate O-acetyltransferase complex protein AlgI